jgi:hypothetical protein
MNNELVVFFSSDEKKNQKRRKKILGFNFTLMLMLCVSKDVIDLVVGGDTFQLTSSPSFLFFFSKEKM